MHLVDAYVNNGWLRFDLSAGSEATTKPLGFRPARSLTEVQNSGNTICVGRKDTVVSKLYLPRRARVVPSFRGCPVSLVAVALPMGGFR